MLYSQDRIMVDAPNAQKIQHIAKSEFEIMYNNGERYCSGELQRQQFRKLTRYSKYTMSIIKHLKS